MSAEADPTAGEREVLSVEWGVQEYDAHLGWMREVMVCETPDDAATWAANLIPDPERRRIVRIVRDLPGRPATPDAGDASEQRMFLAADIRDALADAHPDMGYGERNRIAWDTVDASTSASEPLSEAERDQIASLVHGYGTTYYDWRSLIERIVAAREAKARAEAGEQALIALADDWPHLDVFPGEESAAIRDRAARIAREVTS